MKTERETLLTWLAEAQAAGARQHKACKIVGISTKTYQRWQAAETQMDGRLIAKHQPKNKLTDQERQQIIQLVNTPEYADLPPCQIVPKLADKGQYIASESTFYRVLKAHKQLAHRQKSRPRRSLSKPKALSANAPNQVYTWDITYLPTLVKGVFLYLYMVMDLYSRKIVGWQVHDEERSALSADLLTDIYHRENIKPDQVTLHSDNGSPMKGATMLATLQHLGVIPSFSRPSVSNDNPYSESLFKTLKYRPNYPEKPFSDLQEARVWTQKFVQWYNEQHQHSSIQFITPAQRHAGNDPILLAKRRQVYEAAKQRFPHRWSGEIRNWQPVQVVHLNPDHVDDLITEK